MAGMHESVFLRHLPKADVLTVDMLVSSLFFATFAAEVPNKNRLVFPGP